MLQKEDKFEIHKKLLLRRNILAIRQIIMHLITEGGNCHNYMGILC